MVIYAADLHLAPRTWTGRWSIAGDSYLSLNQLQGRAIDTRCAGVILGGDTTDSNTPDAETLNHLADFCLALRKAGTPVYYVVGQHDRGSNGYTVLDTYGAIRLAGEGAVAVGGMTFAGLDWCSRPELLAALPDLRPADYLVLHAAFRHLLGFAGSWQLEADEVPAHFSRVLAGDVHVHSEQAFGHVTVLSPGSGYACDMTEIGQGHGWFELDLHQGAMAVKWRPYKLREFRLLDAGQLGLEATAAEIGGLSAAAGALPPVAFVKAQAGMELPAKWPGQAIVVRLDGPMSLGAELPAQLADEVAALGAGCLREALPAVLKQDEDPGLYAFAEGLLAAADPRQHLREWLAGTGAALVE